MIDVKGVSVGYNDHKIVENMNFKIDQGEFFGILGPNGSGKTTLLKAITGLLPLMEGTIELKGKPLQQFTSRELAKLVAVLPQQSTESFSYEVKETVMLGRYAHQKGLFKGKTEWDSEVVDKTMEQTGIASFQHRYLHELSGGERQRVFLAQALAQEPEILLLDEPTNHLDLSYQKSLLDLIRTQTIEENLTVVAIFHDLNLASLYCDRLLLLDKGKTKLLHHPEEVLKEEHIEEVYQTKVQKQAHPLVAKPQMVIVPEGQESEDFLLDKRYLLLDEESIHFSAPFPLKCMSSGIIGAGIGWYTHFINRRVSVDYDCSDYKEDMKDYLIEKQLDPSLSVGMMTALDLTNMVCDRFESLGKSVFVVVTAGVGNAMDVSTSYQYDIDFKPGTINTWVFINGNLSDEAYIEAIVTSTEAKVRALQDMGVRDRRTGNLATGTPTDSILIASNQKGELEPFAGPITPVGKLIGRGVYEVTKRAIGRYMEKIKEGG
ncbi:ATP-binding cassette domain-containing protein [Bacillus sp. BHET2]|uniref:adenosylcobinamide amidohydrolase n=1 Tax=Bacillus sp. BHET2 TaxID=2583818 RepID=UPI00110E2F5E|nr:adenosylcobinamide amidohydrolase [Bacillus sp. BHET2]TMU87306.1 ATP-binding cassette domain-containing protein [Bacillus sp. BHET2]